METNSSLRLQLKETVILYDDSPDINDIKEIELVPDIDIFEEGGEIQIIGCLELYGQYVGTKKQEKEESQPQDYVHSVQFTPFEIEKGAITPWRKNGEIRHKIPVNISVSRNRVQNIEEVYAIVDSFDYEINSPRQINIYAELVISGIHQTKNHIQAERDPFDILPASGGQDWRELLRSMEKRVDDVERKMGEEKGQQDERMEEAAEREQMFVEQKEEEVAQQETDENDGLSEETFDEEKNEEEVHTENVRNEDEERTPVPEDAEEDVKVAITAKGTKQDREGQPFNLRSLFTKPAKTAQRQEQIEEEEINGEDGQAETAQKKEAQRDESASYLTSLMGEEEKFTRLKMCIAQKDETLETIAQRYNISAAAIVKANHLKQQEIEPGQILFIPV